MNYIVSNELCLKVVVVEGSCDVVVALGGIDLVLTALRMHAAGSEGVAVICCRVLRNICNESEIF